MRLFQGCDSTLRKPTLPAAWYEKSALGTACFIAYATALYLGCALLFAWVVSSSGWPLAVRVVAGLPLALLSGQGLHLLGWAGHDGFHFNLHRNRKVSATLGLITASAIAGFMQVGLAVSHWNHHRDTNRDGDPDLDLFGPQRTLLSRMFALRARNNRVYLQNTFAAIRGQPLARYKESLPFSREVTRRFALLNVALAAAWLAFYVAVSVTWPALGLGILTSHLALTVYSGLRPYAEHSGTKSGDFVDARTRSHPVFTVLNFGNNFHLEHHLYPSVPCYRLGKVHRLLKASGVLDRAGSAVEGGILPMLRHAQGQYATGE